MGKTIQLNESTGYALNNQMELLGNVEYAIIAIDPKFTFI